MPGSSVSFFLLITSSPCLGTPFLQEYTTPIQWFSTDELFQPQNPLHWSTLPMRMSRWSLLCSPPLVITLLVVGAGENSLVRYKIFFYFSVAKLLCTRFSVAAAVALVKHAAPTLFDIVLYEPSIWFFCEFGGFRIKEENSDLDTRPDLLMTGLDHHFSPLSFIQNNWAIRWKEVMKRTLRIISIG